MIIYGLISSVAITQRGFLLIGGEPVSVSGICYGQPALEPDGVADRRFMIADENFTIEDAAALPDGITASDSLPEDWRYATGE